MGCDIHPVLEVRWKNEETGETKWVGVQSYGYHHVDVWKGGEIVVKDYFAGYRAKNRNYNLFSRLAGVRGDGPEPRGLPDDMSDMTRMMMQGWGDDGHSHSWATAEEWCRAALESEHDQATLHLSGNEDDPRIQNPYSYYLDLDIYEDSGPRAEDYRIVFCFDN